MLEVSSSNRYNIREETNHVYLILETANKTYLVMASYHGVMGDELMQIENDSPDVQILSHQKKRNFCISK